MKKALLICLVVCAHGTGGVGGRRDAQKGRKPDPLRRRTSRRGSTPPRAPRPPSTGWSTPTFSKAWSRSTATANSCPGLATQVGRLRRRQGLHLPVAQRRQFHNGEPFNAAVAKWNLERGAAEGTKNAHPEFFRVIEKIETPDESTLKLTLKDVDSLFIVHMAEGDAVMLPMKGFENTAAAADRHRAVQVRGVEARRPRGDGAQREILEPAAALSRQGDLPLHQGPERAWPRR